MATYGGGFGSKEEVEQLIHRSLMRARAHLAPGERIPPLDAIEVEIVDGLIDEDTGIEIYGKAFASTLKIKVNRQKLTGKGNLENLIYHEFAHLVDNEEGHGEKWARAYMGQVEKWMPDEAAFRWDMLEKRYGKELDVEAARAALFEHGTGPGLRVGGTTGEDSPPRHPAGGSVGMTYQEAVQALIDAGWGQAEAETLVNSLPQGADGSRVDRATLEDIITPGPSDQNPPPQPGQVGIQDRERVGGGGQRGETDQAFLERMAEAQLLNLPTSETDQERYASLVENPSNVEILRDAIANLTQEGRVDYDWVYNDFQLKPGSLDTMEAQVALLDHLIAMGAVDKADLVDENGQEKTPEAKATLVQRVLTEMRGNERVHLAVIEWGREQRLYFTPDERRIANLMGQGHTYGRAEAIVGLAKRHDIDATSLAKAWSGQDHPFYAEKMSDVGSVAGLERKLSLGKSIWDVAEDFKEGLALYDQSRVLATVHVNDPKLAQKLRNDPYSLDSGELRRAMGFLGDLDESDANDPQVAWIAERLAGGYNITTTVDETSIEEAIKTLADAWNMTGHEGVAARVIRETMAGAAAQARAQLPNPFGGRLGGVTVLDVTNDPVAAAKDAFRQTGEYKELIGAHIQPGESEEEYVRRFENRSQAVLGDDVVGVVRNAMRSGNVNTVYQQGLLTDVGESSTRFQEIVARNAQVFREML